MYVVEMIVKFDTKKPYPDSYIKIKLGKTGRAWLNICNCKGQWKEASFHLHNFSSRKGRKIVIEVIK
jgi:hypothetical protein